MANKDAPAGFWPIRHLTGGTVRQSIYTIATGYGTDIFKGDLVKLVTGGGIELAANGNRYVGVFNGVKYVDAAGNVVYSKYWPASTAATEIEAMVYDDPLIVFGAQSAGSTVEADIGELTDHATATGSTATGQSAAELNGSSGTGAAAFRILGKIEAPDNAYGTNVNLEVQPFEHELIDHGAGTPGV